ncbi:META domain-containing protein [Bradyrhizobium sp.]|uniref:META domain-containing protein n=1 Tax=Bradyrhizobium sp. TaxID=376 RepID=UPI0026362186|nr:META domain-containing protein [Bradyrhizobium sp.]
MSFFLRSAAALAFASIVAVGAIPARADDGFPFGFLMTLETAPQPGTKRLPTLEIGDSGEASLDLWCKSGQGQFSVAGNTVIFVPGPMQQRACSPELAVIDDELMIELSEAASWTRQGDLVSFVGTKSLQFRINTN